MSGLSSLIELSAVFQNEETGAHRNAWGEREQPGDVFHDGQLAVVQHEQRAWQIHHHGLGLLAVLQHDLHTTD